MIDLAFDLDSRIVDLAFELSPGASDLALEFRPGAFDLAFKFRSRAVDLAFEIGPGTVDLASECRLDDVKIGARRHLAGDRLRQSIRKPLGLFGREAAAVAQRAGELQRVEHGSHGLNLR